MSESARIRMPPHDLRSLLPGTDQRLARRAAAGNAAAFEAIFVRYHQELFRYCRSVVGNGDDAQDALQSTMASALRSLPGEAREIALRPWLFRVAHNHAISILRARRWAADADALSELPDPRQEGRVEARARLRQLFADLEALTDNQRGALTMRELGGLSFEEVGAVLGISKQAARQTVYEARVALRELERGRSMPCEQICQTLSAGDRRTIRSRRVRAHLRDCAECRRFGDAIGARRTDLGALSPPLPPLAAAALLQSVLGGAGSGVGASAAGGGAGLAGSGLAATKGLGASAALKSASLVAAAAIGVGAADHAGLIDAPGIGGQDNASRPTEPAAAAAGDGGAGDGPASGGAAAGSAVRPGGAAEHRSDRGEPPAHTDAARGGGPPAHSSVGGNSGNGPPAHSSAGGNGPPAHSNAGGNSGNGPPAHSNAGGNGPPAHANAGGGGSGPPAHSSAGGNSQSDGPIGPPQQSNAGGSGDRAPVGELPAALGQHKPPKPVPDKPPK